MKTLGRVLFQNSAMQAFTKWSTANGVEATFAKIQQTKYAGKGLFASRSLECGESVVNVPSDLVITRERALQTSSSLQELLRNLEQEGDYEEIEAATGSAESERMVLRLFLLVEAFAADSDSFWKPYIDCLPTLEELRQYHLLFNSGEKCLHYSGIGRAVLAKRAALEREFKQLQLYNRGDRFSALSLDMWIWADVTFWSRVVSLESIKESCDDNDDKLDQQLVNNMVLVPFFDLANHSLSPNIRWQLTPNGAIQFVTTRDINENDELFLSYGDKSNQELLFLHGFTLEDNPEPIHFKLPLQAFMNEDMADDINKYHWLLERTKPILTLCGRPQGDFPDAFTPFEATGWSFESIAMIYLLTMDEEDGLQISTIPDIGSISLESDKTAEKDGHFDVQIKILGEEVTSLESLPALIAKSPNLAVIQLRTAILLLGAIERHRVELSQAEMEPSHPGTVYMAHLRRYIHEEITLLDRAVQSLSDIRDAFLEHKAVQAYLSQWD